MPDLLAAVCVVASKLLAAVLPQRIEPGQYTAIRFTDRLEQIGAMRSVGSRGDSYDKTYAAHYTSFRRSGRFSLSRRGWDLCVPRRGIGPVGGWYRTEPLSS